MVKPTDPPDFDAMAIDALVEFFETSMPAVAYEFPGSVMVRFAARVRELEAKIAEPVDERPIRKAERERLAKWFEEGAETLTKFVPDGLTVDAIAFLLRLDHGDSPERSP